MPFDSGEQEAILGSVRDQGANEHIIALLRKSNNMTAWIFRRNKENKEDDISITINRLALRYFQDVW